MAELDYQHNAYCIAFVPEDDENSMLLIRAFLKSIKIAFLREIFNFSSTQDRRVVITQRPLRAYNRMGKTLLRSDAHELLYRRKRDELIKVAEKSVEKI